MKLLRGNGKELLVYDISEPVYRITSPMNIPIKQHGCVILDDVAARERLQEILESDWYHGESL